VTADDARTRAIEAGRAIVIAENGECVRASLTWCAQHESRIRKGMSVCDVFLDLLGLMEKVVDAVEPIIRAEEQATAVDDLTHLGVYLVRDEMRRALRAQVEAMAEKASVRELSDPNAYARRAAYDAVLALLD